MTRRFATPLSLAVALACVAIASTAWADEAAPERGPARFGQRGGQVIVTADRLVPLFGYTSQSVESTDGDTLTKTTDTGLSLAFLVGREPSLGAMHTVPRLAIDVTPTERLTIGTSFVLAFGLAGTHLEERTPKNEPATKRENDNPGATILGFAPRVGYVLPIAKNLSFWPRLGFAFYSVSVERQVTSNTGVTSSATDTDTVFSLDLDPQLVWTPFPNVLAFAGPLTNVPLSGTHETSFAQGSTEKDRSDDLTVFHLGLQAGLGVWFDL